MRLEDMNLDDDFADYIYEFRDGLIDEGRPMDEVERLVQEELDKAECQAYMIYESQKEEGFYDEE